MIKNKTVGITTFGLFLSAFIVLKVLTLSVSEPTVNSTQSEHPCDHLIATWESGYRNFLRNAWLFNDEDQQNNLEWYQSEYDYLWGVCEEEMINRGYNKFENILNITFDKK
jgi:hypothetical protein